MDHPISKFYWVIIKHANVLPSNNDFQKLEPLQAFWYYNNILSDSEEMERAMSEGGKESLFESNSTVNEFIESVKASKG